MIDAKGLGAAASEISIGKNAIAATVATVSVNAVVVALTLNDGAVYAESLGAGGNATDAVVLARRGGRAAAHADAQERARAFTHDPEVRGVISAQSAAIHAN